ARYTVDHAWLVPHFEKMLYDNAQLIELLTWAWQESANPLYAQRVRETVAWTLREMIADGDGAGGAPQGAFASSLDADSEDAEGRFYVWSEAQVDAVLGAEAAPFKAAYRVTPNGNWEGHTILNRIGAPGLAAPDHEARLGQARARLLAARAARVRPGWDDKVLADWNGLMIAALANAGTAFEEPAWLAAAERAFAFVCENMTEAGRLRHAWRRGQARHEALVDDYANMCAAALALGEATGTGAYMAQARAWVEILDRHYWDREAGGYFTNAADGERLIVRAKTANDSATPSGNGTMVGVLAQLYCLTGEEAYRARAEALVASFAGEVERNFFPLATLVNGNEHLQRAVQIVIMGTPGRADTQALLRAVHGACVPNRVLQTIPPEAALPAGHPAHGKAQIAGQATAYVCRGAVCSLPLTDPAELRAALAGGADG
ncbi:MAG: thioredoxin domain-containing protein, partial [Kiloniellaceae bacterium]